MGETYGFTSRSDPHPYKFPGELRTKIKTCQKEVALEPTVETMQAFDTPLNVAFVSTPSFNGFLKSSKG